MSTAAAVGAIDLGASSGRVIVGQVGPGRLELREAHRFPNVPVRVGGTLHWDILRLFGDVIDGIRAAARRTELAAVGIDTWGVDYGLIDGNGALLANPVHYRDSRTDTAMPGVLGRVPAEVLYAVTGIQLLPINTIFQLAAASGTPALRAASQLLLIPDLLAYWLTGNAGAEVTNASTTQLLDVRTRSWATGVMERAGIPPRIFPPLRQPGDLIGELLPSVRHDAGLPAVPVLAVASHDTASAVAGVPADRPGFAYISSGTWSLVGMELDRPVLTPASREANFSNEAGLDGTIRYLRNVMGLWLLQEAEREWVSGGLRVDLGKLADEAMRVPALRRVIDPDDAVFLPPGPMTARIAAACRGGGQDPPASPEETVRCILDSLALAYRRAVLQVQELSGRNADVIHLVGGGSRNRPLCQLTADACGLPVVAGPAEATSIGNVLVQARSLGAAPGELAGMRALVRGTQRLEMFRPSGPEGPWREAARRLGGLGRPMAGGLPVCNDSEIGG
jgi:rhamnulokinase